MISLLDLSKEILKVLYYENFWLKGFEIILLNNVYSLLSCLHGFASKKSCT